MPLPSHPYKDPSGPPDEQILHVMVVVCVVAIVGFGAMIFKYQAPMGGADDIEFGHTGFALRSRKAADAKAIRLMDDAPFPEEGAGSVTQRGIFRVPRHYATRNHLTGGADLLELRDRWP